MAGGEKGGGKKKSEKKKKLLQFFHPTRTPGRNLVTWEKNKKDDVETLETRASFFFSPVPMPISALAVRMIIRACQFRIENLDKDDYKLYVTRMKRIAGMHIRFEERRRQAEANLHLRGLRQANGDNVGDCPRMMDLLVLADICADAMREGNVHDVDSSWLQLTTIPPYTIDDVICHHFDTCQHCILAYHSEIEQTFKSMKHLESMGIMRDVMDHCQWE